MAKVIILMGSKSDLEHSKKIARILAEFGVTYIFRVASAHKTPLKVLDIIKEYEDEAMLFITVAGRSNALSGLVDANTTKPVISSPPYGGEFSHVDIFSSLRMPSGVSPMVVLEPEEAALAGVKILALNDRSLEDKIRSYHRKKQNLIETNDSKMNQNG